MFEQDAHPLGKGQVRRAPGSAHTNDLTGPPVGREVREEGVHQGGQVSVADRLGHHGIVCKRCVEGEVEQIVDGFDAGVQAGWSDTHLLRHRSQGEGPQPAFVQQPHRCPRNLRVENNRPFEMLLDPEINANALTWAQDSNKARTETIDDGKGSSLVRGVELRGLEPLTPCMPCRCATSCATAP